MLIYIFESFLCVNFSLFFFFFCIAFQVKLNKYEKCCLGHYLYLFIVYLFIYCFIVCLFVCILTIIALLLNDRLYHH